MKNKLLTLLTLTILTGSLLVGCGGNETETGANNGSGTSTNTEANVDTESNTTVNINPNIEYTETTIAHLFANETDIDKSLVDGSPITNSTTDDDVPYIVKFKEHINIYNQNKECVGYLKTDVNVEFVVVDGGWSVIGSTDYSEIYMVLTDEATALFEVVEYPNVGIISEDEKDNFNVMSDEAKAYLNKIRQGVEDTNAYRKSYVAEHPEVPYTEIVETNSSEDMEYFGGFLSSFDDTQTIENIVYIITFENQSNYTKYYLEYVNETENSVEFNLYVK